jgi:hypothetical protein
VLEKLTGAFHEYDRQCRVDELRRSLIEAFVGADDEQFDRVAKELLSLAWQEREEQNATSD